MNNGKGFPKSPNQLKEMELTIFLNSLLLFSANERLETENLNSKEISVVQI